MKSKTPKSKLKKPKKVNRYIVKYAVGDDEYDRYDNYDTAVRFATSEIKNNGGGSFNIYKEVLVTRVIAEVNIVKVIEK